MTLTTDLPIITDPDDMLAWVLDEGRYLTADEFETACMRIGREHGPWFYVELLNEGLIDFEVMAPALALVWSMAEYPGQQAPAEQWRALFRDAGYAVDGEPADLPERSLTLYRGATDEHRLAMSWTDDLEIARTFAEGQLRGRALGKLWVAEVEPLRLLARIHESSRGESEYVVDTEGLDVTEAP